MKVSICFPTYNHAPLLRRTLKSIFAQNPPFDFEVCVCNDGSTDDTADVLSEYPIKLTSLPVKDFWRNASYAGNIALRMAIGELVFWTTDDVMHSDDTVIERLANAIKPGSFALAACKAVKVIDGVPPEQWETCHEGYRGWYIHSKYRKAMHPFLGAFWRRDVFQIGGWDERFVTYGYDDDWLEACLTRGLGLTPTWHDDIVCYHQDHPIGNRGTPDSSLELYRSLCRMGKFTTETAPWPM